MGGYGSGWYLQIFWETKVSLESEPAWGNDYDMNGLVLQPNQVDVVQKYSFCSGNATHFLQLLHELEGGLSILVWLAGCIPSQSGRRKLKCFTVS